MQMPFKLKVDKELIHSTWTVTNPFSGQSCSLPYYAKRVYDEIKHAEINADDNNGDDPQWDIVRKGITWFQKNFPEEYYVLLD
jgi:hypothetical protein